MLTQKRTFHLMKTPGQLSSKAAHPCPNNTLGLCVRQSSIFTPSLHTTKSVKEVDKQISEVRHGPQEHDVSPISPDLKKPSNLRGAGVLDPEVLAALHHPIKVIIGNCCCHYRCCHRRHHCHRHCHCCCSFCTYYFFMFSGQLCWSSPTWEENIRSQASTRQGQS